ncbi:MAG: phage integrase SAM-like domain-containing protein [Chitinophagaceae bacterium]
MRVSESFAILRDKINDLSRQAQAKAEAIVPFNFSMFYQRFVHGNPLFREKKSKVLKLVPRESTLGLPNAWINRFPILTELHPGPANISCVYASTVKSLLFQDRIGTASSYQSSYSSIKHFRGNVRFADITAQYLKEYEVWMINTEHNSKTTVGIYMRALRAVFNEAIEKRLTSAESFPFGRRRYGIPTGRNIKRHWSCRLFPNYIMQGRPNSSARRPEIFGSSAFTPTE